MQKNIITALALVVFASPALAQEGDRPEHRGPGPGPGHRPGFEHFMEKVDTDKDGRISKAEFIAKAEKHFAEADANGDGYITREEGKAAHEARRAKWREMREKMRAHRDAPAGE